MSRLRRLAVGTTQAGVDGRVIKWALLSALVRSGLKVQTFGARACFTPLCAASALTGLSCRHLDSWLMSHDMCRGMFVRGTRGADFALVDGEFNQAGLSDEFAPVDDDLFSSTDLSGFISGPTPAPTGSDLNTICRWLDLPRIAILDVSRLNRCQAPALAPRAEGLLLDGIARPADLAYWQTTLESLWGVPVLGALGEVPTARAVMDALPPGKSPPLDLCEFLARNFVSQVPLARLLRLANERDLPPPPEGDSGELMMPVSYTRLNVAVAYDEAFHGYFPDTLDQLESAGVSVNYFSPLCDESLPPETDIVYFGCGHPERHPEKLSQNHCMRMALRNHLKKHGRIYAEGGGLAYLCEVLRLADGRQVPMAGILPTAVRESRTPSAATPVEFTLSRPTWLGPRGRRLRGYLSSHWTLEPVGDPYSHRPEMRGAIAMDQLRCVAEDAHRLDLVSREQALGSRVHLNFALLPELFRSFCQTSVGQSVKG
jgi:cobyrinic acid a,c-diamide synthase